jgi:hypothetical protein
LCDTYFTNNEQNDQIDFSKIIKVKAKVLILKAYNWSLDKEINVLKYSSIPHSISYTTIPNIASIENSNRIEDISSKILNSNEIKNFEELISLIKKDRIISKSSDLKEINSNSYKQRLSVVECFLKHISEFIEKLTVYYYMIISKRIPMMTLIII